MPPPKGSRVLPSPGAWAGLSDQLPADREWTGRGEPDKDTQQMQRAVTRQKVGWEGSRELCVYVSFLTHTGPTHRRTHRGSSTRGPNYQWLNSWMSFLPKTTIHTPKLWEKNEIWSHQLNSLKSNSKAKSIGKLPSLLIRKKKKANWITISEKIKLFQCPLLLQK